MGQWINLSFTAFSLLLGLKNIMSGLLLAEQNTPLKDNKFSVFAVVDVVLFTVHDNDSLLGEIFVVFIEFFFVRRFSYDVQMVDYRL